MGTQGHEDMEIQAHTDMGTRWHGTQGHKATQRWGHMGMGTREYGDTEMHRHGDTVTWGHRDAQTRGHSDMGTHGHSAAAVPFWNVSQHQWHRLGDATSVALCHRDTAMLRLLVVSAHVPRATGSGPGLHVSARFRGVPRSTRVVPEECSPTWNETLAWTLGKQPLQSTASLTLRLRRWGQPAPHGDLGATTVLLDRLVADPELPLALSHVPLLDLRGEPTGCTITLRCSYVPRGKAGDATVPLQGQVPPPTVSPAPPDQLNKPPEGSKEDFQVRVRVIKGHQLQGNDIKPLVTVLIGQHRFRTRIRAGNNPYYNEVFCQNFRRPLAQLVEEPIRIQVLNSRATRAKAIIGVFQLDVGTVLRAPGHSLNWKWLSLQHPHQPDTGSRGYLRVSLAVLRAGEPVPEQEEPSGDEDVEANLLHPPPCAATLQIRIYHAEDLPQVEPARQCLPSVLPGSGKREFVAAAVRVSYAGRTLCTRVMPPEANPAWNEVFFFPLRLPPICDEIQLAILSGSRSNKVVGTATLHLSQISSAGAELEEGTPGFLPCFGPSFLTFYGPRTDSARTPSTDTSVAYRGRVLLELSTHMGTPDGRQRDTIPHEDIIRVQRHLPRRHFGLCGVFYSATMVPGGSEFLRFELSLGNYGDTGDVTCKPTASITPHGCPLFDGNRYHYLPWYGDKPVVAVTSSWEDAGHRWDGLNLLRAICRRLERNVWELQDTKGDAAGDVGRRLLRQLAQDCRQALLWLEVQPTLTPLDTHLRAARLHLLRHVVAVAAVPPRAVWDQLLPVAKRWLRCLTALAVEPQAGMPNVLLWLLQGDRRVACTRIPATDLMFSRSGPGACGRLCGRIQTLFLMRSGNIHAQLRVRLWLGRVTDSRDVSRHLEGPLRVYAETYENQTKLLGKWSPRGLLGRPSFSDSAGKAGLPRHKIRPPKGWTWDGPWTVEPQRRLLLDMETNVGEVLEEVYENEIRRAGGEWGRAAAASTDTSGVAVPPKDKVACPQGWHVTDGWRVDMTGAVDEAGWEYGVSAAPSTPPPSWHAAEKTYHTHRRRRWLRTRRRDPGAQGREQDVATFLQLDGVHSPKETGAEAWEYGSLWGSRFHLQPRAGDVCRRRCWHRCMVPTQLLSVTPLFLLEGFLGTEDLSEDELAVVNQSGQSSSQHTLQQPMPFILCTFQRPNFFQLRCYIFQVLDLAACGTKAKADPIAHVSFVHVSQSTQVLSGTLDPLWDQTLLFHRVLLYGDPRGVRDEPPVVVVEVFDQDGGGAGVFLGRTVCTPDVWLDVGRRQPPRLRRYLLRGPRGPAGELLAAFELLHDAEDGSLEQVSTPPWRQGVFSVPLEIRPLLQLVALEVLAWGLRGLRSSVRAPSLEVQCGGRTLKTPTITDLTANPNFPINAFLLVLLLPAEEEYVPPIRLRVLDMRDFGYRPEVGQACVRSLRQYCCQPHSPGPPLPGSSTALASSDRTESLTPADPPRRGLFAHLCPAIAPWGRIAQILPRITVEKAAVNKIYSCELEAVPEFKGLQDFCQTFPLYQPGGHPVAGEYPVPVGEFKGLFRIYPLPEDPGVPPPPRHFQQLPPSQPQKCLVRVYVVRAFDLPPRDRNGLCDPYIRVSLGTKMLGQRDQYVPNTLEPVFARCPVPYSGGSLCPQMPHSPCSRLPMPPGALFLILEGLCAPNVPFWRVTVPSDAPCWRVTVPPDAPFLSPCQRVPAPPASVSPGLMAPSGRVFEVMGTIPLEKDLRVTLLDYDLLPPDQEIGTTTIDLENRLLSRFRAHCGLPSLYCTTGPGCWRDQLSPSQTLEHFACVRGLPAPEFSADGTSVTLGDHSFHLSHFESSPPRHRHHGMPRERLALHVLRACHLVPQHLETRTLYNSTQPGLEQGKVQMWVDVFPVSLGPPGPTVDITPRKPHRYELRCVVWNTRDVDLGDINLTGQRMSDIYVTGWLEGLEEQRQRTDVHYRSLQGDGAFNWRFVFSFDYLAAEQLCVLPRKEHFWSLDETVLRVPPKLILQVWDNDKFSADDFLVPGRVGGTHG
ncbi:fer-1-like protein 5 [Rhynochetos jubatus]